MFGSPSFFYSDVWFAIIFLLWCLVRRHFSTLMFGSPSFFYSDVWKNDGKPNTRVEK
jgi:hypothetical protein